MLDPQKYSNCHRYPRAESKVLVVLLGEFWHKNFWAIDLTTGERRQLTNFPREYLIGDFDISPNGEEIIFSRFKERTDVLLIERQP